MLQVRSHLSVPEMGKTRSRIGFGVWRFLLNSESEWSRNAFFVNLLQSKWIWRLASNFKIETKNHATCFFYKHTVYKHTEPDFW